MKWIEQDQGEWSKFVAADRFTLEPDDLDFNGERHMKKEKKVTITAERLGGYSVEAHQEHHGLLPDRGCRTTLQDALVLAAELIDDEEPNT